MRGLPLLAACLCLIPSDGVPAEWGFDASAAFAYDDNVSNGIEADDRKADSALALNLSGGFSEQFGSGTDWGLA